MTTPPAPVVGRYFPAYDPTTGDFIVTDFVTNTVVDHLPDLLQCEVLIQQLSKVQPADADDRRRALTPVVLEMPSRDYATVTAAANQVLFGDRYERDTGRFLYS